MLIARDIADIGEPDYTLQDLLEEWRLAEVDLAEDARVVEVDGQIAGYRHRATSRGGRRRRSAI